MKKNELRVGEKYGVMLTTGMFGSEPVPAVIEDLDAPYEFTRGGWGTVVVRAGGGIRVRFLEPTRVGSNHFSFAKRTNDHAGPVTETYTFGPDKNKGGLGRFFVGRWDDLVAQKKAEKEARKRQEREGDERADAFAPVLAEFIAKCAKVGLKTEEYDDASGLHGDVDVGLYATGEYDARRATSFKSLNDVKISFPVFERLLDLAVAAGVKLAGLPEEEDD